MAFKKTVTVKISAEFVGTVDSYDDYKLVVGNTDYIGDPVLGAEQRVIVPGRDGYVDYTETIFGEAYYTHRPIKIEFGGIRTPEQWDASVNYFRSVFEGVKVKVEFSTLPGWYFTGRATIEKFNHKRSLGTFTFAIPYADPYMYQEKSVSYSISAGERKVVTIKVTRGAAVPTITCTDSCTVEYRNDYTVLEHTYSFEPGTYRNKTIVMTPTRGSLLFIGGGNVTITWLDAKL